jgi:hypothetical protein
MTKSLNYNYYYNLKVRYLCTTGSKNLIYGHWTFIAGIDSNLNLLYILWRLVISLSSVKIRNPCLGAMMISMLERLKANSNSMQVRVNRRKKTRKQRRHFKSSFFS